METGFTIARAALNAIAVATGNGHTLTLAASLRSLPVNGYANDEQIETMQTQLDGLVEAISPSAPAQPVAPPTSNADDGASLAAEPVAPVTDTAPSSEPPLAAPAA